MHDRAAGNHVALGIGAPRPQECKVFVAQGKPGYVVVVVNHLTSLATANKGGTLRWVPEMRQGMRLVPRHA